MFKRPITTLATISVISLSSLIIILKKFEPCVSYKANSFCGDINTGSIVFFQTNLFLFSLSLVALLLYLLKNTHTNNLEQNVKSSVRQSFLISIYLQFILTSLTFDILYSWNAIISAAILLTIELITRK